MRLVERFHEAAFEDFSLVGLKVAIIVVGLLLIFLALSVNNKWFLAGTLAWTLLP